MSTCTQVVRGGLYELTEEARAELVSSKYYNDDLAPTSVSQRTWTTYNISMLWVGMAICIPSLSLASGLIGMGVSPWLAIINVALGNLIILIPIQLNSQIGTKYGIPFPLFARLTFGTRGAQIPAILRAVTACGWTSVQAWVGGGAVAAMLGIIFPVLADASVTIDLPSWGGMQTVAVGQFVGYTLFIIFIAWIAYNGMEQIKWIQNIGGPLLLVVMVALLIWAVAYAGGSGYSFGDILNSGNNDRLIQSNGGFLVVYLSGLMGNIAFWATMALNIPDFSRYAKSQAAQFKGQLYGMPLPMAFCAFVGAVFAKATELVDGEAMFDPTGVFYHIENKLLVLIAALGVIAATVTTCVAANVVAPANGFSNMNPKKISYKKGVVATISIAFFILQAWWIYGSGSAYFTWMNAYGTILAPIAAIFIADYFICKSKQIEMVSLFKGEGGRYWYNGGFNYAAIIAWVVSFILPLLAYFPIGGGFGSFLNAINTVNYLWSFAIGFIVYVLLMRTDLAGNSRLTAEEVEAIECVED